MGTRGHGRGPVGGAGAATAAAAAATAGAGAGGALAGRRGLRGAGVRRAGALLRRGQRHRGALLQAAAARFPRQRGLVRPQALRAAHPAGALRHRLLLAAHHLPQPTQVPARAGAAGATGGRRAAGGRGAARRRRRRLARAAAGRGGRRLSRLAAGQWRRWPGPGRRRALGPFLRLGARAARSLAGLPAAAQLRGGQVPANLRGVHAAAAVQSRGGRVARVGARPPARWRRRGVRRRRRAPLPAHLSARGLARTTRTEPGPGLRVGRKAGVAAAAAASCLRPRLSPGDWVGAIPTPASPGMLSFPTFHSVQGNVRQARRGRQQQTRPERNFGERPRPKPRLGLSSLVSACFPNQRTYELRGKGSNL